MDASHSMNKEPADMSSCGAVTSHLKHIVTAFTDICECFTEIDDNQFVTPVRHPTAAAAPARGPSVT